MCVCVAAKLNNLFIVQGFMQPIDKFLSMDVNLYLQSISKQYTHYCHGNNLRITKLRMVPKPIQMQQQQYVMCLNDYLKFDDELSVDI